MAVGDLTAEEQVWQALCAAHEVLVDANPSRDAWWDAVDKVQEAIKRIHEARSS